MASPVGRSHGSRSRFSIAVSIASSSFTPPRARNLMPLSGIGLWLAESTTPRSAPSDSVRNATPGVGSTPRSLTSTPADSSPATTAASRNSPERRVSRPTTARSRCPLKTPASPRTCAAATERSRQSSAVTTEFASPRTPSVPKRRPISAGDPTGRSALAVLGSLAGLLEAGLLALDDAGVTREQPGLLQRRAVGLHVDRVERTGHAQAQRAGLAGDAAAVDAGDDVEAAHQVGVHEGLVDDLLVQLVREVVVERAAVDGPLAGARDEAHAGDGLLAAAGRRRRGDGGRAGRRVLGRVALGAVGDALLVGLEGLLDLAGGVSHGFPRCLVCSSWCWELLRDLGDLERLGLLRLVRVLRTGVHLQLLEHLAAETVLREHPPHGRLDRAARVLLEELAERGRGQAARVTGVAVGQLGGRLVTGERDLAGVHDDDEVTAVDVRGVGRLVLAAEQGRDVDREPDEPHVGGVDDVPLALDVSGLRAVRAHVASLSGLLIRNLPRSAGGAPRADDAEGRTGSQQHGGSRDRQDYRRPRIRVKTSPVSSHWGYGHRLAGYRTRLTHPSEHDLPRRSPPPHPGQSGGPGRTSEEPT